MQSFHLLFLSSVFSYYYSPIVFPLKYSFAYLVQSLSILTVSSVILATVLLSGFCCEWTDCELVYLSILRLTGSAMLRRVCVCVCVCLFWNFYFLFLLFFPKTLLWKTMPQLPINRSKLTPIVMDWCSEYAKSWCENPTTSFWCWYRYFEHIQCIILVSFWETLKKYLYHTIKVSFLHFENIIIKVCHDDAKLLWHLYR